MEHQPIIPHKCRKWKIEKHKRKKKEKIEKKGNTVLQWKSINFLFLFWHWDRTKRQTFLW
jgi:hypothetical protein